MKKKLILLLSTTLFLTACGMDYNYSSQMNQTNEPSYSRSTDYATESATDSYVYEDANISDKKNVSYTGHLNLETKDFETDRKHLLSTVEELGGKVSNSQTDYREDYYTLDRLASVYMTVQVPQDKALDFINQVEEAFNVSHSSLTEVDEGESQERLDVKIEMTKEKIKDYQEELNTNISDEDRAWIRKEIADLESELYYMELEYASTEGRIAYSNFDIDLNEVVRFAHEKPSLFESLRVAFRGFGEGVAMILRGTVGVAIGLVPIAFVLFLMLAIYRRMTNYDRHIHLHHKGWYPDGIEELDDDLDE